MDKLISKASENTEKVLRHHFKKWFQMSDDLKFSYDIKLWGQALGLDNVKIDDAVKIAKKLKRTVMATNPMKTVAAVTFYWIEGAGRKSDILKVFEFSAFQTLKNNLNKVERYKLQILPIQYH